MEAPTLMLGFFVVYYLRNIYEILNFLGADIRELLVSTMK